MLTQNVFTVGTATTTVVAPTVDAGRYTLKNLQPHSDGESLARQGYVYQYANTFTITGGSTASFSFLTGATGAQLEFYQITTTDSDVKAELIEGATVVTTGNPIPAYNVNRNFSDAHGSVLKAATSVTGGTTVTMEYLTGTKQAGSAQKFDKVITLEPNTEYAFKFTNAGSQTTTVFFEVGWSELYNGYNDIWLGTPNESYVLHGGEELNLHMLPYETINATGGHNSCRLAVMRQD